MNQFENCDQKVSVVLFLFKMLCVSERIKKDSYDNNMAFEDIYQKDTQHFFKKMYNRNLKKLKEIYL